MPLAAALLIACSGTDTPEDSGAPTDASDDTGTPDVDSGAADAGFEDTGPTEAGPTLDERLQEILAVQTTPVEPLTPPPAISPELYDLGLALFFDPITSGNIDVSCATCHHPTFATGDGLSLSVGTGALGIGPVRAEGAHPPFIPRNAPPLFNKGAPQWTRMFWDGRVETSSGALSGPAPLPDGVSGVLAAQALFPLLNRLEMRGMPGDMRVDGQVNELAAIADDAPAEAWAAIMARLLAITEYEMMFQAAFPELGIDPPTIAHAVNAIAAFETVAFAATNTPWDRYLQGEEDALDASQKLGAIIFYGAADCGRCHAGALLTDQKFHNTGIPQIGPGVGPGAPFDLGRETITGTTTGHFAFRTPPLRNVLRTAPYMHNGSLVDLNAVLRHYAEPEGTIARLDPASLHPDLRDTIQDDPAHVADLQGTLSPDLNMAEDGRTFVGLSNLRRFMLALEDPSVDTLDQLVPDSVPSGYPLVRE